MDCWPDKTFIHPKMCLPFITLDTFQFSSSELSFWWSLHFNQYGCLHQSVYSFHLTVSGIWNVSLTTSLFFSLRNISTSLWAGLRAVSDVLQCTAILQINDSSSHWQPLLLLCCFHCTAQQHCTVKGQF